jgi:hypothetical protein
VAKRDELSLAGVSRIVTRQREIYKKNHDVSATIQCNQRELCRIIRHLGSGIMLAGVRSGLLTHIATTESGSLGERQQNGKVEMRGPFRL